MIASKVNINKTTNIEIEIKVIGLKSLRVRMWMFKNLVWLMSKMTKWDMKIKFKIKRK